MITSITIQPATNAAVSAYRPIIITPDVVDMPVVVYCDIYIDGIYYKTISKTQNFEFDIEDACQEALKFQIGAIDGSAVVYTQNNYANVYCKFRQGILNADGFIVSDSTAPVQGTGGTPPVAGDGYQSNTFFVLNVAMQYNEPDTLEASLSAYKSGTWNTDCYPLTHRPDSYQVNKYSSDYYPFFNKNSTVDCIRLNYRTGGQLVHTTLSSCYDVQCVSVGLGGVLSLPDAQIGQPYAYSISLTGDTPITIATIDDKPLWMTVAITGGRFLEFGGTPPDSADNVHVKVTLQNCNAASTLVVEDYINVTAVPCQPPSVDSSPGQAYVNQEYSQFLPVSGDDIIVISAISAPSWLTVELIAGYIKLTGTPTAQAQSEAISFTLTNDCGNYNAAYTINTVVLNEQISFRLFAGLDGQTYFADGTPACDALATYGCGTTDVYTKYIRGADFDNFNAGTTPVSCYDDDQCTIIFQDTDIPANSNLYRIVREGADCFVVLYQTDGTGIVSVIKQPC